MMLRQQSHLAAEGIQAHDALPHGLKRKADLQDNNERLSKRLSLLNLGKFAWYLLLSISC